MSQWPLRFAKARAACRGGLHALSVRSFAGDSIRIPLAGHRRFWVGDMQDADLVSYLAARLPDDGVFLDVGANIGVYSAALARAKRGRLRGAAFEPVPATHRLLRETLRLNGMDGFLAEQTALGSARAELMLSAHGGGANNALVSGPSSSVPTVKVPCIRLDDWVESHAALVPDAMKIDVEGQELAVLEGAVRVLANRRPVLAIECHCASWPALGISAATVTELLAKAGYQEFRDRSGAHVDLVGSRATVQILCTA